AGLSARLRAAGCHVNRHQFVRRGMGGKPPGPAARTCRKRLGPPCSSIRPTRRPPRPQQETCKLLPAGSGRKFEVLDASTSREIDGAFATAFFSRTARRILRGRRPAFRTPAITI